MNRDDIIRMAREAGFELDCCSLEWHERIARFAALVAAHTLTNIDPSKFMSYQEALEAGRLAEREACHALRQSLPNPHEHCQVSAHAYDMAIVAYGKAIRARGAHQNT